MLQIQWEKERQAQTLCSFVFYSMTNNSSVVPALRVHFSYLLALPSHPHFSSFQSQCFLNLGYTMKSSTKLQKKKLMRKSKSQRFLFYWSITKYQYQVFKILVTLNMQPMLRITVSMVRENPGLQMRFLGALRRAQCRRSGHRK